MNSGTKGFPNNEQYLEYSVQTYGFNPADGTTYYFTGDSVPPSLGQFRRPYSFKVPAVIVGCNIELHSTNAAASSEAIPLYIQVNGLDDYLIQNIGFPAGGGEPATRCSWYNMNMNVLLKAADIFSVKMVCPTWTANPTFAAFTGQIFYKIRV